MLPLAGFKIVSFAQAWAGPYATMMLADMGADLVKVEPPGIGDHIRKWTRAGLGGLSPHFIAANRNKRSIVLDLRKPAGLEVALALIAEADALVENFSPGTMDKLGLGYDKVGKQFPKLIYTSISGFGATGPYAARSAYDLLIQGEGGVMSVTGNDGVPAKVGVPAIDVMAGMVAAYSTVCALMQRSRTGLGQHIDLSMLETAASLMSFNIIDYAVSGRVAQPMGTAHPLLAPYQSYPTKTAYINVGILTEDHWVKFCAFIGRADLAAAPEYSTAMGRVENRERMNAELEPIFRSQPAEYWIDGLNAQGMVCGRVSDVAALTAHPQLNDRDFFYRWNLGGYDMPVPKGPWRVGGADQHEPTLPPANPGQHTEAILSDWLGYSRDRIQALARAGAVSGPGLETGPPT